ncbi:hypothetical protein [Allosphingosinicella indica]|uniref:hypothetical protein n=1 Tax=Allosphingosinicella indica TaxID=941907 RepID=UPI0012F51BF8|nr:hypothetical protein [Allosphingosinicella indica]
MDKVLRSDRDWAAIDGELCRVRKFREFGARIADGKFVEVGTCRPYAIVSLECRKLPVGTVGCITHKLDFAHLWAVFRERGIGDDEEALIFWTRRNLKPVAKAVSLFMPKLWVMIWTRGAYERETDPELRSRPGTEADMVPIISWKPGVMN